MTTPSILSGRGWKRLTSKRMKGDRHPARIDNKDIVDDWIYDDLGDGTSTGKWNGDKKTAFYRDNKLWEARWTYGNNSVYLRAADPEISDNDVNAFVNWLHERYDNTDNGSDFQLVQVISVKDKNITINFYWEEL